MEVVRSHAFTLSKASTDLVARSYIVYCVVLFCMFFVIYFLFPETRGKSLEQVRTLITAQVRHQR